jgi:hypothetical protein
MKIFVGTLYSGENEFEECLASIRMQSYKHFQHFIFKDLPNKEAHVTLFKVFLENASEYDVLVKVDADIVLTNDALFEKIVQKLKANDWMDLFSIAVYDFFSDQLIWGLNSYRNSVRWDFEKETIFVDIPEITPNKYFFDNKDLAPAAIHCKNPSPYQAFHYGVHRGLKSLQPIHGTTHWSLLERTWLNFQRTKDIRVGFASLGVELAYSGLFGMSDLDYTNSRMKDILENYLSLDAVRLDREIKKLRLLNWGVLPGNIRRRVLRLLRSRK